MSGHDTRIWVLITDGMNSRLCSCLDGMTAPITSPLFDFHGTAYDGPDLRAYRAWFKAEPQKRISQNPRHQCVFHLCQLLLEGARARVYDGLIIIAEPALAAELEGALPPEARALLIGKIVRDASWYEPENFREQQNLRH